MSNLLSRPSTALRVFLWAGFFSLVLVAWGLLWLMAAGSAQQGGGLFATLCRAGAGGTVYWAVVLMWAVMAAAMMAPTMVPSLRCYLDLAAAGAGAGAGGGAGGGAGFLALLGGYLAVWAGASAVFGAVQVWLARAGWLTPAGASVSLVLSAGLCALAGAYQFSRFKDACLSACRAPLTVFIGHWRPGVAGAFAMGLRMGVVCLGCCWALMALAFVGGMTNLVWMGLATLLMVLEKWPDVGRPLTRPLGWALLAGAAALGGMALAA